MFSSGYDVVRRIARRIRPYSSKKNVMVEDEVALQNCTLIGLVLVGFRSYANDSLLRNVELGRYCSIGRRSTIGAAKHDTTALTTHPFGAPYEFKSDETTQIGHDVWIGDNVIIMSGLKIGTGAVIGAGSIVTKDIEPYSIALGIPARHYRSRFNDRLVQGLLSSQWWEFGDAAAELSRSCAPSEALKRLSEMHDLAKLPPHHRAWRSKG